MELRVNKLDQLLVIQRDAKSDFFITTTDSLIIPLFNLSALIKFLVFRGFLSPKVLEGILEEYYNSNE